MRLVPGRFAVADQQQASGLGTGRNREIGRFLARDFDTDIYTNFLS
jgi:hypothetical protein